MEGNVVLEWVITDGQNVVLEWVIRDGQNAANQDRRAHNFIYTNCSHSSPDNLDNQVTSHNIMIC
jgi:hypothetical protein